MEWERLDRVLTSDPPSKLWRAGKLSDDVLVFKNKPAVVRGWLMAFCITIIVAVGGLLALVLHLRARRVASDATSRAPNGISG